MAAPSVFAYGKSSSLKEGASPLCRCATSLPTGETSWIVRKTKAFLPEEGGAAQAVTDGAARWQVCTRANLKRILPICKTPSVLPRGGNPAPSKREPALSVAARHLSRRERQVWIARKTKAFLPEEGGTAQAVTEGAARWQVCIRANLMRILPICKTPSVFA